MLTLTDENFETTISNSQKPVLVDFWSVWCVPCLTLSPILEKIAKDFEDKITFVKVDLDTAPATAQKYQIDRIPRVILFKNGEPINDFVGLQPEFAIKQWLENVLKEGGDSEIENLIKEYEEYAIKNGFRLNPNKEVVKTVIKGLLENEKKYNVRYCPCRRVTGNPEEDKLKICPCFWHKEEIGKNGQCLCGLFVR